MLRVACTLVAALSWATLASAQGPAPSSAAGVIQPGTYDLEITFGGGVLGGRLDISTVGDSLAAKLQVGEHDSPVRAANRQGARLVLEGTGSVQVRYQLEFKEETVSGSFNYEGQAGTVTGRLRKAAGH
jgi:hypothetical protein